MVEAGEEKLNITKRFKNTVTPYIKTEHGIVSKNW